MVLILKNLLFTVIVPGTVAVYVPMLLVADRVSPSAWAVAWALPVLATGTAVYAWCVWDFATFGRGTPAPVDAPKHLVVHGLYRYTRNPMYVGVLTVIVGWAVLFQAGILLGYAALVGTAFHLMAVLYEEPHLRRVFGADYDRYRAQVGRWLPAWRPRV
jgi:protein-S-isoprenylcysteine O-methyltransferase Ste14